MILILKWILFLPVIILTNLLVRVPVFFIYDSVIPFFTGKDSIEISYSWLAVCFVAFRDFLATAATLYVGLKLIDNNKKIAFYLGAVISITILVIFTIMFPIRFNQIGIWNTLGELGLLAGQGFGVYKAITYIKEEFYYDIYNI